MKRWLHWLLRIENNMSPFSIKHHTSWNESESFESQFTVFFTYKITVCWVGTSKVGRINCIELTGKLRKHISIFLHEKPPYYCRNSKLNTCTFWVPLRRTRHLNTTKKSVFPQKIRDRHHKCHIPLKLVMENGIPIYSWRGHTHKISNEFLPFPCILP